jgi:hypothetical protein
MKMHPLGLAVALSLLTACELPPAQAKEASVAPTLPYAVFERLAGTVTIPMQPGTNLRTFNHNTPNVPGIALGADQKTIVLEKGTYRITGMSITTYEWGHDDANSKPRPGYAFLWKSADTTSIVLLGSIQDPQFSAPSEIDGFVQVTARTGFQLGHQNGNSVGGVKLETGHGTEHGGGHVMARLVVQRVGD